MAYWSIKIANKIAFMYIQQKNIDQFGGYIII